jgi:hypothetical protein
MQHLFQFNIAELIKKKERKEFGMELIKCGVCDSNL